MRFVHNRISRLLALAILMGTILAGTSEASTITITPTSQSIALGGTASVDLVLSGLTPSETVGGFYINLVFNPSFLTGFSFINDPGSVMGALPLDLSGGFTAGNLDLFFIADAGITQGSQGSGFVLATLVFTGTGEGISPLTITAADLSNFDGTALLTASTIVNGSVCVDDPTTTANPCSTTHSVPESPSVALMFVGLAGLAALALRRHRLLNGV